MTQNTIIDNLPNGLTILLEPIENFHTVAIGLLIKFGSRYETDKYKGIAHFLEHMMFKGTKKRTAKDIAEEMESVGGDLNAFTSRENTVYSALVLKENIELGMDIISDMIINSTFPEQEIEREREVIIQEIYECIDDPSEYLHDNFVANIYKNQSLGHNILGTLETVGSINQQDLFNHKSKHYGANNMILVISGSFDVVTTKQLIEKYFSNLGSSEQHNFDLGNFNSDCLHLNRDLEQLHLQLGFNYVNVFDQELYAAQIFSTILGGGMSSRLFQEIREKKGLAYGISSYSSTYSDLGLLNINVSTSNDHVEQLAQAITDVVLSMESINEIELKKAKMQFKAGLLMAYDGVFSRGSYILNSYIRNGKVISIDELIKQIDSIEIKDLHNIFNKFIAKPQLSIASLGSKDHNLREKFKKFYA